MSDQSKVKFKNKSKDKTSHKCDFCGEEPENLWEGNGIEGQYCFEHFRLMHENTEEFDEWCVKFKGIIDEC